MNIKVGSVSKQRTKCLKKFLYYFKKGFKDQKYVDWERSYKLKAHDDFIAQLSREKFSSLLAMKKYNEIASVAVKIESRTNLLFSFEKIALRDAIKSTKGAENFATGLYDYIYGKAALKQRFENWVNVVSKLPRVQTRVLTWPLVTVFGFIADPGEHIFLKPRVTKIAAEKYMFDFIYSSRPCWETYHSLLSFASEIEKDTKEYSPRDYIDIQSFIWVLGSDEYPD